MGILPAQHVAASAGQEIPSSGSEIDAALLDELFRESDAVCCGLDIAQLNEILVAVGLPQNFGQADGAVASRQQQAAFFRSLRLADLVLARACALGSNHAWEHFIALYRQPLTRAAIAICGSETLGVELAEQLYGELFGLASKDGERRCPLLSYRGRGSLIGWLRTTLAQRHVDHHRRTHREEPLGEIDASTSDPEPVTSPAELSLIESSIQRSLAECDAEQRFLLASYYLDGHTLIQIAGVLHVHEATVSRKLQRALRDLRKQVMRNLQSAGLSRQAAKEAFSVDPRDLHLNLKILLQHSQTHAFQEKAAP